MPVGAGAPQRVHQRLCVNAGLTCGSVVAETVGRCGQMLKDGHQQRCRPPPPVLSPPPSALSPPPSAPSPLPSPPSPPPSALSPRPSALGPRPSALSSEPSALSPEPPSPGRSPSAPRAPQVHFFAKFRQILPTRNLPFVSSVFIDVFERPKWESSLKNENLRKITLFT